MADIFEIKTVDVVLKVGDKEYPFTDPRLLQKIQIHKEFSELNKKKEKGELGDTDYLIKADALNTKLIKVFLPSIEDSVVKSLGDRAKMSLINKITELSDLKFGSSVKAVEGK